MICSNCGKENKAGAKFCAFCGTGFSEETLSAKVCPACSKENTADKKFCIFCGTKLVAANETPICYQEESTGTTEVLSAPTKPGANTQFVVDISNIQGVPADSGVNRCTACFRDNLPGARFCLYCGNTLGAGTHQAVNVPQTFGAAKAPAKKKKGGKIALIIIIILLLLGAVAGGLYSAYEYTDLFSFLEDEGTDSHEKTTRVTTENVMGTEPVFNEVETPVPTETKAQNSLENVFDESGVFTEKELADLNTLISEKEKVSSLDIYMIITDSLVSQMEAAEKFVEEKGGVGVGIVVDTESKETYIKFSADGETRVNGTTSKLVFEKVQESLSAGDYYMACEQVLSEIYDNEETVSYEMVEGSQQVVYVTKDRGANTGKLVLVDWTNGPKVVHTIDKVYLGRDGITTSPSESKCATPQGTFRLGFAFSDDTLNTKLDTVKIKQNMVWVDDASSKYYNTLQNNNISDKDWSSAEDTYNIFKSGYNNACILIEHNGDGKTAGASGKGSCIYLAGKEKDLTVSYGDVNISASQMTTLLSYLDESLNPYIVIR